MLKVFNFSIKILKTITQIIKYIILFFLSINTLLISLSLFIKICLLVDTNHSSDDNLNYYTLNFDIPYTLGGLTLSIFLIIFLNNFKFSKAIKFFKTIFTFTKKQISESTSLTLEMLISVLAQLLPEKQDFHKRIWLGEFDNLSKHIQKIAFSLGCLQTVLAFQRKRLPKHLIYLSNDQQITLTRLLFTSSLLFFFQVVIVFSAWFITHNLIITSASLFISLKIFSNIYQSTKTQLTISINHWSLIQISLLSFCCVPAFQSHNTDSQLILLSLLTLHILFFQPLVKEIIALLQKWREQSNDDLSER